ncbi:MAG: efflux RND transporter periplasmic adaptor subunit [Candidatus Obscuribacterales bacterium]|nr:efflux RND transporter periplasmic adaptor subunit [Candidatus Obscuribacterales bacterium]
MTKIILFLLLILSGLPATAHEGHDKAFGSNNAVVTTNQKVHISPSGQRSIGLESAPVKLRYSETYLEATGTVRAADDEIHYVSSTVSGVVRSIYVKQGETVKKGQLLASIYSAEVAKVLGNLLDQRATINSELAKKRVETDREIELQTKNAAHFANDLARESQLLAEKITARKNYLDAKHAHETAEIQLESIKKQQKQDLHLMNQRLSTITEAARRHLIILGLPPTQIDKALSSSLLTAEIPILAPASGSLFMRDVTMGESVGTTKHLFSIVKLSPIWVVLDIHQDKLDQLRLRQPVEISTPAGSTIQGSISSIATVLDPGERTAHVRVVCDNRTGELRPEMFVTARILTGKNSKKIVMVPTRSVIEDGDRSLVYVQYGEDFQPVFVIIGARTANGVEILDGLYEGDRIVVNGAHQIKSQSMLASTKKDVENQRETIQGANPPGIIFLLIALLVGIALGTALTVLFTRKKELLKAKTDQKEESLT